MDTVILTLHIIIAIFLIGVILLQRSEGGALGIGGGGGGFMGGRSAASALTRTTVILAAAFFATSFGLGFFAESRNQDSGSVLESVEEEDTTPTPAAPSGESPTEEKQGESSAPDTTPEPPAPAEPESEKAPAPPEPQ